MTAPDFDGDLRVLRESARRPLTPEQSVWDGHWCRWLDIARRSGRGYLAAIQVAYTRTEAQYGSRPVPVEARGGDVIEAHREELGGRSVTVVAGTVSTIPSRAGEDRDEVAYERGDPAGSVPVETPKETQT